MIMKESITMNTKRSVYGHCDDDMRSLSDEDD